MTLKIQSGRFYRTRDGRKVGPVFRNARNDTWPWAVPQEFVTYADNGSHWSSGAESDFDLIEEWTDETDLTAITTPDYNDGKWHGWNGGECPVHPKSVVELLWPSIMDETKSFRSTQQADGFIWVVSKNSPAFVFRVVKPYTAPREWWIVAGCEAYASEAEALEACKALYGNPAPVHVREVKE